MGEEYKGYIFRITGGNDKQGFPMKQGILTKGRPKILMSKGHSCYRTRRSGERKRKSVRGCIVENDIRVLALTLVRKGEKEIEGLTNDEKPRRLGPKRASKIRKLFGIKKTESQQRILIQRAAVRRTWTTAAGKNRQKAPKVQRLITETRLRRKRIYKKDKKSKWEKTRRDVESYNKFLAEWSKKKAAKKSADIARKRSSVDQQKVKATETKPVVAAQKTQQASKTAPQKKVETKAPVVTKPVVTKTPTTTTTQ